MGQKRAVDRYLKGQDLPFISPTFAGSGNVVKHPMNVRGRSVRSTTPVNCTLFAMAMLLLTGTILGGEEPSKG